jgi:diaminohydroxyphosphoribosylaminopyrimidine deaminase/5-amino-6-(5-phosphoribosylamino)uracil reductase
VEVADRDGHLDLHEVLRALGSGEGLPDGARPVQSVLVEAGPGLATALLSGDLVDRLFVFVAPRLVGDDGVPALGSLSVDTMAASPTPAETHWEIVGADALMRGYLRAVGPA